MPLAGLPAPRAMAAQGTMAAMLAEVFAAVLWSGMGCHHPHPAFLSLTPNLFALLEFSYIMERRKVVQ